jgi:signal transduction histidine kinase
MRLPSVGLLGRIILILGFVLATEFVVNTVVFDRVSRFALRDDEAHRMAEYLVVARRVLDRTPPQGRMAAARELSTPRVKLDWRQGIDTRPTQFDLNDLRAQMLTFEPKLLEAKLRLHLLPLRQGGDIAGSVELTDHTTMIFHASQHHAFWQLTAGRAVGLGLPMLALAILGALMIRATLKPLRQLMKATSAIGAHEPAPVKEEGPSEMRGLIRDFNAMQMRIHRMVTTRTQALMAVGHDLRTPLARLELRLEEAPIDPAERSAMLDDVTEMSDLIKSLQIYMGGEGEQMPAEKLDLAVMAATIVDTASDSGHDALYDGPGSLEIWGRPVSIRRALTNLVENALHYGGNARLSIRQSDDAILICVDDDGPGIPPDKIEAVVHPFTRLSEGRARNTRGMGLGLAIVTNAVKAEGATFTLENRPEGGLRATIRLSRPQG